MDWSPPRWRPRGAAAGRGRVEHRSARLDEFDPPVRAAVLGARPGAVVGPVNSAVVVVQDRRLPALDDDAVRRLAEEVLIARAFRREMDDRVVWHVDL